MKLWNRGGIFLTLIAVVALFAAVGYALAHEEGQRHTADPTSPSDLRMEHCTTVGMGPEGHTIAGGMIDQMHGEGAHHRMHRFMDQMMRGGAMGPSMMGNSMMNPGSPKGGGMMRGTMANDV